MSARQSPIEYSDVVRAFDDQSVMEAPNDTLKQYLLAIGRARILDPSNRARAANMASIIQHLLTSKAPTIPTSAPSETNRDDDGKNRKITVFLGSSTEAKSQAKALMRDLASPDIEFLPWWDCFTAGHLLLDDLEEVKKKKATAALLLFSPDIAAKLRGKNVLLPNQNVLFELGYFFSAFSRSRIALVRYGATHVPKDLDGYTHIPGSEFFRKGCSVVAGKKTKVAFVKWATALGVPKNQP